MPGLIVGEIRIRHDRHKSAACRAFIDRFDLVVDRVIGYDLRNARRIGVLGCISLSVIFPTLRATTC